MSVGSVVRGLALSAFLAVTAFAGNAKDIGVGAPVRDSVNTTVKTEMTTASNIARLDALADKANDAGVAVFGVNAFTSDQEKDNYHNRNVEEVEAMVKASVPTRLERIGNKLYKFLAGHDANYTQKHVLNSFVPR